MEVVGYECFANGTVKPAIMPIKERKNEFREREEEFYGSHTMKKRSGRLATQRKSSSKK